MIITDTMIYEVGCSFKNFVLHAAVSCCAFGLAGVADYLFFGKIYCTYHRIEIQQRLYIIYI